MECVYKLFGHAATVRFPQNSVSLFCHDMRSNKSSSWNFISDGYTACIDNRSLLQTTDIF